MSTSTLKHGAIDTSAVTVTGKGIKPMGVLVAHEADAVLHMPSQLLPAAAAVTILDPGLSRVSCAYL